MPARSSSMTAARANAPGSVQARRLADHGPAQLSRQHLSSGTGADDRLGAGEFFEYAGRLGFDERGTEIRFEGFLV